MDNVTAIDSVTNLTLLSPRQLRDFAERSCRIFNVQGYGFWEWELATDKIVWAGDSWSQYGYSQDELHLFNTSKTFSTFVHPDDLGVT